MITDSLELPQFGMRVNSDGYIVRSHWAFGNLNHGGSKYTGRIGCVEAAALILQFQGLPAGKSSRHSPLEARDYLAADMRATLLSRVCFCCSPRVRWQWKHSAIIPDKAQAALPGCAQRVWRPLFQATYLTLAVTFTSNEFQKPKNAVLNSSNYAEATRVYTT
jgi:hypothetical protein